MKIAIIGGSISVGLVLAQELAKRRVDVELLAPDATDEELNERAFDVIVREQEERIEFPSTSMLPDWSDTIKPHRQRYNRKPKWQQNGSSSKYF